MSERQGLLAAERRAKKKAEDDAQAAAVAAAAAEAAAALSLKTARARAVLAEKLRAKSLLGLEVTTKPPI